MLSALQIKILAAILAAVLVIAGVAVSEHEQHVKAEQRLAQQRAHDDLFRAQVEAAKKKSKAYPAKESKTWSSYVP